MYIRVNKNTGNRRQNVKYAALSTGTISHVWYDEESASTATPKRTNRIKLTRAGEMPGAQSVKTESAQPQFDA